MVLVRVFPVNRTQLNEGGAFANRWAGPYKVIEQVAHQSYRLELHVRAASRMGRVTNVIELKPYQLRHAEDADRILRSALRDKTNPDDLPDPGSPDVTDLDTAVSTPTSRFPTAATTQPLRPSVSSPRRRTWPRAIRGWAAADRASCSLPCACSSKLLIRQQAFAGCPVQPSFGWAGLLTLHLLLLRPRAGAPRLPRHLCAAEGGGQDTPIQELL